jgi:hypothetical protein
LRRGRLAENLGESTYRHRSWFAFRQIHRGCGASRDPARIPQAHAFQPASPLALKRIGGRRRKCASIPGNAYVR